MTGVTTTNAGEGEPSSVVHPRQVPKRIVAIAPNAAEIICALGGCDRIVGVSKYCIYPPELHHRQRVGGLFDPDIERILAIRPDLIVLRGHSESIERLAHQQSIDVYLDQTDSLAGVVRCTKELGNRLRLSGRARDLIAEFERKIEDIKRRMQHVHRPRVFVTLARQPDRLANLLTAGKGTFVDEMIEIAGGINVFGHLDMSYPQVSPEGVVAHRPDVIIELLPEAILSPKTKMKMLGQWKELGPIPAVIHKRVYFMTGDNVMIPSLRYVSVIEHVVKLLHPELGGGR